MRTRHLLAAAASVVCAAVAAPAAQAMVPVKVTPKKPYVDDSVVAKFKVHKRLKRSMHYEATLIGRTGFDCASFVHKTSKRHPKKGKTVTFRFSSYDDKLSGGPEFCQGKASVMISTARNRDGKGGKAIGISEFRFYGMP